MPVQIAMRFRICRTTGHADRQTLGTQTGSATGPPQRHHRIAVPHTRRCKNTKNTTGKSRAGARAAIQNIGVICTIEVSADRSQDCGSLARLAWWCWRRRWEDVGRAQAAPLVLEGRNGPGLTFVGGVPSWLTVWLELLRSLSIGETACARRWRRRSFVGRCSERRQVSVTSQVFVT